MLLGMELFEEESFGNEKNHVSRILQSKEGPVEIEQMVEEYNQSYKPVLQKWKSHFMTLEAFSCGPEIKGT